jgi:hypothetical protein
MCCSGTNVRVQCLYDEVLVEFVLMRHIQSHKVPIKIVPGCPFICINNLRMAEQMSMKYDIWEFY